MTDIGQLHNEFLPTQAKEQGKVAPINIILEVLENEINEKIKIK